ncbi:sortase [Fundicoccus culcitae]|uniref:Sortase n=1 Tax=Fundicoccus culcitae TaxID=2969821 RepID=A0ABY5P8V9_9LACT|nr:sortase [Fundicoccus culcitae]UUX35104.1 sortase [Fundicoccus culcitae]
MKWRHLLGLLLMLAAVAVALVFARSLAADYDTDVQNEAVEVLSRQWDAGGGRVTELASASEVNLQDPFEAGSDIAVDTTTYALLQIPRLGQLLPVHFGASPENLATATAFLAGSDLPEVSWASAGGARTVIAGHRGYYGQTLFLHINQLVAGDDLILFYNHNKYHYTVTESAVIGAHDVAALEAVADANLLTLLTCTPIPTFEDRLLVNAQLLEVENLEAPASLQETVDTVRSEAVLVATSAVASYGLRWVVGLLVVALAWLVVLLVRELVG